MRDAKNRKVRSGDSRGLRRAARVVVVVIAVLLAVFAVAGVGNLTLTLAEKGRYRAPGMLVEVGGGRMHVYSEGTGSKHVVLLSGWGTASPAIDFKPLMEALRADFRVTIVEYLGYGWSDWTRKPRTNRNIVEETRLALREVGVLPPYILVPHSISGLYALYYANTYPSEVEAVVGLDSTIPQLRAYYGKPPGAVLPALMRVFGVLRLLAIIDPEIVRYRFPEYSAADRRMIAMMYFWNYGNRAQANEYAQLNTNAGELQSWRFPTSIPVSMILSRTSVGEVGKAIPGLDLQKIHEDMIRGNGGGKIYILDGGHYIHWANEQRIAAIIKETSNPPTRTERSR
jgi:pimeloyl-ACP methyl ester carboxylesterase